jgi:hypothetical protein
MTLHLYCIRRAGEPGPPDGLPGVAGAAVERVEEGALGAWISRVATPAPDEAALRAHDAVVRLAMRTGTPLPARFGGPADEAELRARLRAREGELAAVLDFVAGHVEMALTLAWDEAAQRAAAATDAPEEGEADAPPGSGRAYLRRRKRERAAEDALRARAAAAADAIDAAAAEAVSACERTLLPRAGVAAAVAHLVRVERVPDHRVLVERAAAGLPGVSLRVGGPWAPYSFTRAGP